MVRDKAINYRDLIQDVIARTGDDDDDDDDDDNNNNNNNFIYIALIS